MVSPAPDAVASPSVGGGLWIELIGRPRWHDDSGHEGRLSRLDAALLAVLAHDGEQPRERLCAWLWPQASQAHAALSLRQRIHRLWRDTGRRVIDAGPALALAEGVHCSIDPAGSGATDGELLAGFDYGDRDTLDAWVQAARQHTRARQLDALAGEAARLEASGALAAAIATCEQLLARGPLYEHGWRRLMRLHFRRGDRAAAIDSFERFERLVRDEQGSRPAAETIELLQHIERSDLALAGPAAGPPRAPRLIGRGAAWQALQQARQAGRAVLLVGAAGVGKTRLIDDWLRQCAGAVRVGGQPGDATMPYALLQRLLQAVLERHAPPLTAPVRAELARLQAGANRGSAAPAQQSLLWQAVATVLEAAARQGLDTVAVDDLQSADAASLELLRWLVASPALAALRFVFGARPDDSHGIGNNPGNGAGWRHWLEDSTRLHAVRLAPWTESDIAELLASLAWPGIDPARLAPLLHRHTGGHPYFTLETLQLMRQEGRTDATLDSPLPQPATVTAILEQRLAGLTPSARDMLRLLALTSGALAPTLAAEVLVWPADQAQAAWAELEAGAWVAGSGPAHDLIRQAVIESTPLAEQARLRGRAAAVLSLRPEAPPGAVADLWVEAGAWTEAVPWLRRAAAAARMAGRLGEYVALLDRAADASRQAGDVTIAIDIACEALPTLTLQQGSPATLARVEALWPQPCTPAQRARLAVARSEAELNLARFDDALHGAEIAVTLAPEASAEQADALALHGRTLAVLGQAQAGITRLTRALDVAERLHDQPRRQATCAAMAYAQFAGRRFRAALSHQQHALALARDLSDPGQTAECAANLALMHFVAGDAGTAGRYAQEADRGYVAMGADDAAPGVMNRVVLARVMAHLGRFDIALRALDAACASPVDRCGATTATLARTARLLCRLWLGDLATALADDEAPPAEAPPLIRLGWWQVLGRVAATAGQDPAPAWARADGLLATHPGLADEPLPLMELSRRLEATEAVQRLRRVERACRRDGRIAQARSLAVHALARLTGIDAAAAAALARQLQRELPRGLSATVYPPEAWTVLAHALPPDDAARCRARALSWLQEQALPHVPALHRPAFLNGNPVNRALWTGAGLAPPSAVSNS